MTIEETWRSDDEVSGCMELRKQIFSDSVSFTKFSTPQKVRLTTQESESKRTLEDIPVDFVYNMRQINGMDSIGWEGAGFLNGKLQYTGFTIYNQKEERICANQYDFLGQKVKNKEQLKKAIKSYYGEHAQKFRETLNSLPEEIKYLAKKVLL